MRSSPKEKLYQLHIEIKIKNADLQVYFEGIHHPNQVKNMEYKLNFNEVPNNFAHF